MNGNVPVSSEAIDDQRRVILLSKLQKKHVYCTRHNSGITSITRTFISMEYGFFPEQICSIVSQFKLLKVLDVSSVNYDFSRVIPQLVHLRYVDATVEEALPLAKLRNLQTVILPSTNETELEFPQDIWTASEIRHLDIRSPLYISNPLEAETHSIGEQSLFLNNLQTLHLYYSPFVAEIIRRTPNLRKLMILDDSEHPDWPAILDSLNLLEELETLDIETEKTFDSMIFSRDILPLNLKQLRLSYTCIPWEVMNLLADLPNLELLKGKYAYNGTDWRLHEDVVFRKLKYLRLMFGRLKRWETAGSDNFPMLEKLILDGLDELEEIPQCIGEMITLKLIHINLCGSAVITSAKKIREEQESWGNYELQVLITHGPIYDYY